MPTYPKLLPWLARRAGVSTELAEKLWRRAVSDAAGIEGSAQGSDFHRFAIERFIDLLAAEDGDAASAQPRGDWYWHYQRRMATLSFRTVNLGCFVWDAYWKKATAKVSLA